MANGIQQVDGVTYHKYELFSTLNATDWLAKGDAVYLTVSEDIPYYASRMILYLAVPKYAPQAGQDPWDLPLADVNLYEIHTISNNGVPGDGPKLYQGTQDVDLLMQAGESYWLYITETVTNQHVAGTQDL